MTNAKKNMKQLVAVVERKGKSYWTNIGVAMENSDGSWYLRFDFLPTDPATTIQMRPFKESKPNAEASADAPPPAF
jgi:hypothetical protein